MVDKNHRPTVIYDDTEQLKIGAKRDQRNNVVNFDPYNRFVKRDTSGNMLGPTIGATRMHRPQDNIAMSQMMPATNFAKELAPSAELRRSLTPSSNVPRVAPSLAAPASAPVDAYAPPGSATRNILNHAGGATSAVPDSPRRAAAPPSEQPQNGGDFYQTGHGITTVDPETGRSVAYTPTNAQAVSMIPGHAQASAIADPVARGEAQRTAIRAAGTGGREVGQVIAGGNSAPDASGFSTNQSERIHGDGMQGDSYRPVVTYDPTQDKTMGRISQTQIAIDPRFVTPGQSNIASVRGAGAPAPAAPSAPTAPPVAPPVTISPQPALVNAAPVAPISSAERATVPTTHVDPGLAARQIQSGQAGASMPDAYRSSLGSPLMAGPTPQITQPIAQPDFQGAATGAALDTVANRTFQTPSEKSIRGAVAGTGAEGAPFTNAMVAANDDLAREGAGFIQNVKASAHDVAGALGTTGGGELNSLGQWAQNHPYKAVGNASQSGAPPSTASTASNDFYGLASPANPSAPTAPAPIKPIKPDDKEVAAY